MNPGQSLRSFDQTKWLRHLRRTRFRRHYRGRRAPCTQQRLVSEMVDPSAPSSRIGRRHCPPNPAPARGTRSTRHVHDNVLNSRAVQRSFNKYGDYFLAQSFPEGSPTHPAYPTGHGAVAGACITVLKFFFDGNFVVPNPMVSTADGLDLVPYTGGRCGPDHRQRGTEQTGQQRLLRPRHHRRDPLADRHQLFHSTGRSRRHQHAAGSGRDLSGEIHDQPDQDRRLDRDHHQSVNGRGQRASHFASGTSLLT